MTDKYNLIFFAGPGNKESFEQVQQAFAEKTAQGHRCIIIGDGVHTITRAMINAKLNKDNVASDAWIGLNFHGGLDREFGKVGNSETVVTTKSSHIFQINEDEDAQSISTEALFKLLAEVAGPQDPDVFPGMQIHLYSCHGGAAVKDYNALPKNSVLFAHSSSEFPINSAMSTRDMVASIARYPNHPFEEFAQTVPESAITTTIHAAYSWKEIQDGKEVEKKQVLHHTARPPAAPITTSAETTRYLQRSIADYQEKLALFDHTLPPITISEELASRYHQEHCAIQIDRDDTNFAKAYITKAGVPSSLLNQAIVKGKTELVELMLQAGAALTPTGDTIPPLIQAVYSKATAIAELLLEAGTDPNSKHGTIIPLHLAFEHKNIPMMRALLEAGADPSVATYSGESLLHHAVASNNKEIVDLLLEKGADVNSPDNIGTPLGLAVLNNPLNAKLVEALVDAGADTSVTLDGIPVWEIAKEKGHSDLAEYLLQTELMQAIEAKSLPRVKAVIAAGADVNAEDTENYRPLHRAAENGSGPIAKALLEAGADITAEVEGKTARQLAEEAGKPKTAAYLKEQETETQKNSLPAVGKHVARLQNEDKSKGSGPAL